MLIVYKVPSMYRSFLDLDYMNKNKMNVWSNN